MGKLRLNTLFAIQGASRIESTADLALCISIYKITCKLFIDSTLLALCYHTLLSILHVSWLYTVNFASHTVIYKF